MVSEQHGGGGVLHRGPGAVPGDPRGRGGLAPAGRLLGPSWPRPSVGKGTQASPLHPPAWGTATPLILQKGAGTAREEYFLKAKRHCILDSEDPPPPPEPSPEGAPEFTGVVPTWRLLLHVADFGFVLKFPRGSSEQIPEPTVSPSQRGRGGLSGALCGQAWPSLLPGRESDRPASGGLPRPWGGPSGSEKAITTWLHQLPTRRLTLKEV